MLSRVNSGELENGHIFVVVVATVVVVVVVVFLL